MARMLAAGLGILLGSLVAIFAFPVAAPRPALAFHVVDADRAAERWEDPLSTAPVDSEALLFKPHWPREAVQDLMPLNRRRRYDEYTYYKYRPGALEPFQCEEHPSKKWKRKVNSLGLRDRDEWREDAAYHVLVAGDSHIDGVCVDAETFPSQVERLLQEQSLDVQAMNGAHGGYHFYHYVGLLQRFLHLELIPDLFVVVIYGGNDLGPLPKFASLQKGQKIQHLPKDRVRVRAQALEQFPCEMGQMGNSIESFAANAAFPDIALGIAKAALAEMRRLCEGAGIEFLVVYLPAALEIDRGADLKSSYEMLEALGRDRSDVERLAAMNDRLLTFVRSEGIPLVDLRASFLASDQALYWNKDLHLSTIGHRLAAEQSLETVKRLLTSARSKTGSSERSPTPR